MVEEGDTAPEFTAPMALPEHADGRGEYTGDDVEAFTLSEALADGPVVLAFFPGAFTRTCTKELCGFRDWRAELDDLDAAVYGVSADTPWALLAFIEEYGMTVDADLLEGIAGRAVFVIDADRTVRYRWEGDDLRELPDLDALESAVATV